MAVTATLDRLQCVCEPLTTRRDAARAGAIINEFTVGRGPLLDMSLVSTDIKDAMGVMEKVCVIVKPLLDSRTRRSRRRVVCGVVSLSPRRPQAYVLVKRHHAQLPTAISKLRMFAEGIMSSPASPTNVASQLKPDLARGLEQHDADDETPIYSTKLRVLLP